MQTSPVSVRPRFGAKLVHHLPSHESPESPNTRPRSSTASLLVELEPGDHMPATWNGKRVTNAHVKEILFVVTNFERSGDTFFSAQAEYADGKSEMLDTTAPDFREKLMKIISKTTGLDDTTKTFFKAAYEDAFRRD